jgi:hypothetical protein
MYDRVKQAMMMETDRPHVLRETMYVCRPAGVLSVPGVYGGLLDKMPMGAVMNKGLTIRTGQTHVNRWTDALLTMIVENQIDPSFVITHIEPLEHGPEMYKAFRDKQDGCIKVVLKQGRACDEQRDNKTRPITRMTRFNPSASQPLHDLSQCIQIFLSDPMIAAHPSLYGRCVFTYVNNRWSHNGRVEVD